MIKGSDKRTPAHPVHSLFVDRWSPRAMSGEPISDQELHTLFEAARWAPSASNVQPWRFLYARRDSAHWQTFFDLLMDGNKPWTPRAAVLLVVLSEKIGSAADAKLNETHAYDAGAAWMSLALQGSVLGLAVHGIGGFHRERAREVLKVPERFHVNAMAVIGRPGDIQQLPEPYRPREIPSDRRPVADSAREGLFAF